MQRIITAAFIACTLPLSLPLSAMGTSESKAADGASPAPSSADGSPGTLPHPTTPNPPATPFALHMKRHFLNLLFDAIDVSHHSYIDRTEILDFLHHEPYLSSPHLQSHVASVLTRLTHDEDSHCSRHEFHAAFDAFPPHDITRLVVNLIRQIPLPGSRLRRRLTLLETQVIREGKGKEDEKGAMVVFMLDVLFHSIDTDLDGLIEMGELNDFIQSHTSAADPCSPIHSLHEALQASVSSSATSPLPPPASPVAVTTRSTGTGVSQDDFVSAFSSLPLSSLDQLFLHLLSRSTSTTLHEAGNATRHARKTVQHRQMMDAAASHIPAHDSQRPCHLIHPRDRFREVQAGVSEAPMPSITLTLLGQSMIQHDLHSTPYGCHILHALPPHLQADVTFTELETSVQPSTPAQATRSTVFLHTAPPVVIDCLKDLGTNVIALANNHAGDMGKEGVQTVMEEVEKRGLAGAGVGKNLEAATAPAYLTITPRSVKGQNRTSTGASPSPTSTAPAPSSPIESSQGPSSDPPSVTVALVAHASKVPAGSEATATSPGVNSLTMAQLDTYTLNPDDVKRILSSVSVARQHASIVIAYQHNHYWQGNGKVNEEHAMGNWKREWAHALIDSGATVYVSHGDPRLQGIEVYNGCPIFFCLGSFMFQTKTEVGFYGPEVWQSCIVTLEYHTACSPSTPPHVVDRGVDEGRPKAAKTAPRPSSTFSIKLTPLTLNEVGVPATPPEVHFATRGLPKVALGEEGKKIVRHVGELSRDFGTRVEIEEGEGGVVLGWVVKDGEKGKGVGVGAAVSAESSGPSGERGSGQTVGKEEGPTAPSPAGAMEPKAGLRGSL